MDDFLSCTNTDEERLLVLYRDCLPEQRSEFLFRLTRLCFAPWFEPHNEKVGLCDSGSHLYAELEQSLRDSYPMEILERLQISIVEPQLNGLWIDAWGSIAKVLLGPSENDGQYADKLYAAVREYCQSQRRGDLSKFGRGDALELITVWRADALQKVFTAEVRDRHA
jgi:hypothetical protein